MISENFLFHLLLFLFKDYFEDIKSKKIIKNNDNNPQNVVSIFSLSFLVSIENHPCYPNKKKTCINLCL